MDPYEEIKALREIIESLAAENARLRDARVPVESKHELTHLITRLKKSELMIIGENIKMHIEGDVIHFEAPKSVRFTKLKRIVKKT